MPAAFARWQRREEARTSSSDEGGGRRRGRRPRGDGRRGASGGRGSDSDGEDARWDFWGGHRSARDAERETLKHVVQRLRRSCLANSWHKWRKWTAHATYRRDLTEWVRLHLFARTQARVLHAWHVTAAQSAHTKHVGSTLVRYMATWRIAGAFNQWNNAVLNLKKARKKVAASLRRMRSGLLVQALACWCEVHMEWVIMKDCAGAALHHWRNTSLRRTFQDWRTFARLRRGKLYQNLALASHSDSARLRSALRAWHKLATRLRRQRQVARAVASWRNKCVLACFAAWREHTAASRPAAPSPAPTPQQRGPGYLRVNPVTPWSVPAGLGSENGSPRRTMAQTTPMPLHTPFAPTLQTPRTPYSVASVSDVRSNGGAHYLPSAVRPGSRSSMLSERSLTRTTPPSMDDGAAAAAAAANEAAQAMGGLASDTAFVSRLTKQFKRRMMRKHESIETLIDASVSRIAAEARRRSMPQQRAAALRLASARANAELAGLSPAAWSRNGAAPSPQSASKSWLDDESGIVDEDEMARARAWHANRMHRRKEHVLKRWMAVSQVEGGSIGRIGSPDYTESIPSPTSGTSVGVHVPPRTPTVAESAAAEARIRFSSSAAPMSAAGGTALTAMSSNPRAGSSDPYELALWRLQDEANRLRRELESGGMSPTHVATQCERLTQRLSAARTGHAPSPRVMGGLL